MRTRGVAVGFRDWERVLRGCEGAEEGFEEESCELEGGRCWIIPTPSLLAEPSRPIESMLVIVPSRVLVVDCSF